MGRWCKAYDKALLALESASSAFLSFPVDMKGIKKFEKKWPISINVYSYSGVIYPMHLSMNLGSPLNLLLYREHYYLMWNISSLIAPQCKKNRRKCYVCSSCLSYFVRKERYDIHMRLCKKDGTQYVFPRSSCSEVGILFIQQHGKCSFCHLC